MRLIVFGATGATGKLVVDRAVDAGHQVTAFVRSEAVTPGPEVTVVRGSVLDQAAVAAAIRGHDAVVSALGTRPWHHEDICSQGTRVIAAAMAEVGVTRLVVVSTQGIGNSSVGTFAKPFVGMILGRSFRDKAVMEDELAATSLDWTIVRPGILTNGAARGAWRTDDQGSIKGGKIARADISEFIIGELAAKAWLRKRPTVVW